MLKLTFESGLIHWRGPAPYYFLPVPAEASGKVTAIAKRVSYGWGVIPVSATIEAVTFSTSLFPRDGLYLLPLKVAVRQRLGETDLTHVVVEMVVGDKPG